MDTPFIGNDGSSAIQPENLAIVNKIGYDNDGDGAIDSLEDAAPNSGDGNNDGIQDSTQVNVASFPGSAGEYVVIEAPGTAALHSLDILGTTFALANPPTIAGLFDVLDFSNGFAGFDLAGIAPGAAASVTETFTDGFTANIYYIYGPTPDNTTAHWYEFLFDGETGAEIAGNVITLNLVDGKRGDGDLDTIPMALSPWNPVGLGPIPTWMATGLRIPWKMQRQTRVTATTTASPTALREMAFRFPTPLTTATLPWLPPRRWLSNPRETRHRFCS